MKIFFLQIKGGKFFVVTLTYNDCGVAIAFRIITTVTYMSHIR